MLKIQTIITDSEGGTVNIENSIDTFSPSINNFTVSNVQTKKIKVGATNQVRVEDVLAYFGVQLDSVSFLHIQLSTIDKYANVNDGRFALSHGGNLICSVSQFTIANVESFLDILTIEEVIVTQDSYLIIMVGEK